MQPREPKAQTTLVVTLAILAVAGLALFKDSGFLRAFDVAAYAFALEMAKPVWTLRFWQTVTEFGSGQWIYPAFGGVFLIGLWRRRSWAFVGFVAMASLLFGVNPFLKWLIASPRPALIIADMVEESSYGFPSGHSVNAVLLMFVLLPLAGKIIYADTNRFSRARNAVRLFVVVLIGYSRVMLGFHWATDVLAGWIVGAVLSYLIVKRMERV